MLFTLDVSGGKMAKNKYFQKNISEVTQYCLFPIYKLVRGMKFNQIQILHVNVMFMVLSRSWL